MTDSPGQPEPVTVVVTVPNGVGDAGPLMSALHDLHSDWDVVRVWAGDPQLRPSGTWVKPQLLERQLASVEPEALPLLAALGVVSALPNDRHAIVLTAGSVAVLDRLDTLVPARGEVVVVPRVLGPMWPDERFPQLADLAEVGAVTPSVLSFGAGERPSVVWLREHLLGGEPVELGPLLDLVAQWFPARRCTDARVAVSSWRWTAAEAILVDAPAYDPARPWLLDPGLEGPPRVSLADADRSEVMRRAAPQLGAAPSPLCLPGGLQVDEVVRRVVRAHPDLPWEPWSAAARFRRWLGERYWTALHDVRPDVAAAFPSPLGADAERFAMWTRHAAFEGNAPLLVDPSAVSGPTRIVRTDDRADGVNLIGYFRHQSGVANVGRRIAAILERHGIPHTVVAYERTESPLLPDAPDYDQRLEFATSLVFVNGDQFAMFHHDLPAVYGPGRRVIGLWNWELETYDGAAPVGDEFVDEVWAATTFIARAVEALGTVPVRVVAVPFTEPEPSDRARREFPPLADAGDRFVFGVVLDHFSITARKNPLGAIRAFTRAFRPQEGPLLVVKTINAHRCWQEHERLLAEAAGRDDIVVWDEHLARGDHLALMRSFDALVSLHRSEGIGLHLTEAMWMQVPVVTTRYSGNLDFMDDSCAILVDYELVPVGEDGGWAYPVTARWADPDLDQAAAAMRRLVEDRAYATRIGAAGRARMLAEPGEAGFAARLRLLLGL